MHVDERDVLFTDLSAQRLNVEWYGRYHRTKVERMERLDGAAPHPAVPSDVHIWTSDVITVAALKERLGWTSGEGRWREVNYSRSTDLERLTREHGAVEIRFRVVRGKRVLHTMLVTDKWCLHSQRDSWPLRILDVTDEFRHTFARAHSSPLERREWYATLTGIENSEGIRPRIGMSIWAPPQRVRVQTMMYCESRHYCSTCCAVTCHCRSSYAPYSGGTLRLVTLPLALRSLVCADLTCREQRVLQLT